LAGVATGIATYEGKMSPSSAFFCERLLCAERHIVVLRADEIKMRLL